MLPEGANQIEVNGPSLDADQINSFPSVSGINHQYADGDGLNSIHEEITPNGPPLYNQNSKVLGIVCLLFGFLTCLAGVCQIFVVPLLCTSGYDVSTIEGLNLSTFYGFALWTGFIQVINGATGMRSTLTNRRSTVHRFFATHVLSCVMYMISVIIMIKSFVTYIPHPSFVDCIFIGHYISAGILCLGLIFQTLTLCLTYETLFEGRTISVIGFLIYSCIAKVRPSRDVDMNIRHEPLIEERDNSPFLSEAVLPPPSPDN